MRKVFLLILFAFAVTLAAVVGMRMSAEAVAVVVGVVCGVAAAIPMSLLLLAASQRRQSNQDERTYGPAAAARSGYPPVVIVQGGQPVSAWQNGSYPAAFQAQTPDPLWQATPRQFRVIGEDD